MKAESASTSRCPHHHLPGASAEPRLFTLLNVIMHPNIKLPALTWIAGGLLICGCASTQPFPSDAVVGSQSGDIHLESSPPIGPLKYRLLSLDLHEVPDLPAAPSQLVFTNQPFSPGKLRFVRNAGESPWPSPSRLGSRPEHLINTGYTLPVEVHRVEE
jgi:hypothetical protein